MAPAKTRGLNKLKGNSMDTEVVDKNRGKTLKMRSAYGNKPTPTQEENDKAAMGEIVETRRRWFAGTGSRKGTAESRKKPVKICRAEKFADADARGKRQARGRG
jgi:hypothetical protein